MSIFRRVRGMHPFKKFQAGLAVSLLALTAPSAWAASEAQLLTYQSEGGATYFALSMTPSADQAVERPSDVVILFDTSASQTGAYRETAFAALEAALGKLRPDDRVALVAADLEARPITDKLLKSHSGELQAAVEKLRGELPLGSTDMEAALRAATAEFEKDAQTNRTVLYIGDGLSTANLLGSDAFRRLIDNLRNERISVNSYAIGPRHDAALLAAIANQTGGNLYVDEAMELADDAEGVSVERANEENLRRGTRIGEMLADWTRTTVIWPEKLTLPAELGDVLPKQMPPLRTDRDSVVVGSTDKKIAAPVSVTIRAEVAGKPTELAWTVSPAESDDNYAYLAQVVESSRADDGLTTSALGLAGLAETGRVLDNGLEEMNALAKRAFATGDMTSANLMSQAVLRRDPGNIQAKTVQHVVERQSAPAAVAVTPPANNNDLNLVRTAQAPVPPQTVPPQGEMVEAEVTAQQSFPIDGALVDQFDEDGALLDQVEQQKRVFAQMLRREVENMVIDARRMMSTDPEVAGQQLKLALQNVERAPELNPEVRAQLMDKLRIALREVQRQAAIKDELDAAREEQLAVAREQQLINERLARDVERQKQLIGRFGSLIDERRYNEAIEVADIALELNPEGVAPTVAVSWSLLNRNVYLAELAREGRWRGFVESLYAVETSSIPTPDDPPIIYPAAPFWEELTVRRKKFASVDLKAAGGAEQRINEALASPLKATGLDFTEEPLENVVSFLQTEYEIPIQLEDSALEDAGLTRDEPVNVTLRDITLRSALRLMLKQKQLTYVIRDEVLIITTPEEAESELVAKVYPVADLVLPIEVPSLGGGGGGLGGQMGGGQGGGQGGGGGGFGGGGGGGGLGGGGGGMFSVPDNDAPTTTDLTLSKPAAKSAASSAGVSSRPATSEPVASIEIDKSLSPEVAWNQYFAKPRDPAAVRATARELMKTKEFDQSIAMIEAALRHGQPQAWMYESLGIAMELDGRSKAEIERVVMSAADFATTPDELMYIASYLSRSGLDRRSLQLCQQVVKLQPLRREAYALGLHSAEQCVDLAGIQWATVGILSQAWPKHEAPIEKTATQLANATLARLEKAGRDSELVAYRTRLDAATQRDCVVQVSWTGDADVDFEVEEPSGTICSLSEPRTSAGGVNLGDAYAAEANGSSPVLSEAYVCPQAFAGTYRVRIHRVWGDVAAGKVTVDVFCHRGSDKAQHERRQLELTSKDAMVVFDLDSGRRSEPLESAQLAGAVERQQQVSRAVLAQQIESASDASILSGRSDLLRRRQALGALGIGGAVGYQPIIQTLPEGAQMSATAVISADRRYVRFSSAPTFSTIGDVQTFTFAGSAEQAGGGGAGAGIGGQ